MNELSQPSASGIGGGSPSAAAHATIRYPQRGPAGEPEGNRPLAGPLARQASDRV